MEQQANRQDPQQTLLDFFRVLSDLDRLKIAGLLAQRRATVADLARALDLREPDVVRHLARLEALGLVRAAQDESMAYHGSSQAGCHDRPGYCLDEKALIRLKKEVFASGAARARSEAGLEPEQKTLAIFVSEGRLMGIPAQHQRRVTVTRWLVGHFEPGVRYSEKEVNEIIQRVHHDSSSLRRYMVDYGFMQRDHGIYWRTAERA
jgi:hypothetical protein